MAIHNILIPKGDDFELRLTLRHSTSLRCDAVASANTSTIKINPIGASMAIGEKLYYGACGELVLAAPVTALSMTATLENLPNALSSGSVLRANPIDITGWQGFSSIRSAYGAPLSWDSVCTIDGLPIDGTFLILLPRVISRTIPANCSASALVDLEEFDINNPSTWGKLAKTAYVWDFDTLSANDRRNRQTEGRALVSGEVTI